MAKGKLHLISYLQTQVFIFNDKYLPPAGHTLPLLLCFVGNTRLIFSSVIFLVAVYSW